MCYPSELTRTSLLSLPRLVRARGCVNGSFFFSPIPTLCLIPGSRPLIPPRTSLVTLEVPSRFHSEPEDFPTLTGFRAARLFSSRLALHLRRCLFNGGRGLHALGGRGAPTTWNIWRNWAYSLSAWGQQLHCSSIPQSKCAASSPSSQAASDALSSHFGAVTPTGHGAMSWLTWWARLVHVPSCMPAHQTCPGPRRQNRDRPPVRVLLGPAIWFTSLIYLIAHKLTYGLNRFRQSSKTSS